MGFTGRRIANLTFEDPAYAEAEVRVRLSVTMRQYLDFREGNVKTDDPQFLQAFVDSLTTSKPY